MPSTPSLRSLDDERAHWTGLTRADLRAFDRAPLDPRVGFALPDRVPEAAGVPVVAIVRAVLEVLGDDGVAVAFDGAFDAIATRAVAERSGDPESLARSEGDVPFLRDARLLAEAAGLAERRMGRLRATALGRRLRDDADALLPHLLRAWARRPVGASGRFAKEVHAIWPLAVLLLRRFGGAWRPMRFYAAVARVLAPAAVAAAPGYTEEEAADAFLDAFSLDVLLHFAAAFGLIDFEATDDQDAEPMVIATSLLDELLPLAMPQAPAAEAFDLPGWADADAPYGDAPAADAPPRENAAAAMNRELAEAIRERAFASEEELQGFVAAFVAERNAAPLAEFDGLSPGAMQQLLYHPFGEASPLVVADVPRVAPRSPLLHLALDLAEALGDDGVRATQRGNLPRAYVLDAVERYAAAGWPLPEYVQVRNEGDFGDLSVARWVARAAGLVTLRNGRWSVTRAYRKTIEREGAAGVYAALFRAFVTKYAWNSADLMAPLHVVQSSWAYSLLLLLRYGATPRAGAFYTERFLRAFPMAVDEAAAAANARAWSREPREDVAFAYELRVLERFALSFGLVEVERGTFAESGGRLRSVRATPALAEVVAERVG